jgi:hypothetical protein
MDYRDELVKRAEYILTIASAFPVSYNEAMIRGWVRYVQRALIKCVVPDNLFFGAADDLFNAMIRAIDVRVLIPQTLQSADLKYEEAVASTVEGHIVRLGLLPRLDELTLEDCIETENKGRVDSTAYVGALQTMSNLVNQFVKEGRLLPPELIEQLHRIDLAREAMDNPGLPHPVSGEEGK